MVSAPQLTIIVDAHCTGAIGYGTVWDATVREVVEGRLADRTIRLTMNASPDVHGRRFNTLDVKSVTLRLQKVSAKPAMLYGFIASDGTVWEIVDVRWAGSIPIAVSRRGLRHLRQLAAADNLRPRALRRLPDGVSYPSARTAVLPSGVA